MATTNIGFLVLEIEQREQKIERLKRQIKQEEKEVDALRQNLRKSLRSQLNLNDGERVVIQITHAGKTRQLSVDSHGVFRSIANVIVG